MAKQATRAELTDKLTELNSELDQRSVMGLENLQEVIRLKDQLKRMTAENVEHRKRIDRQRQSVNRVVIAIDTAIAMKYPKRPLGLRPIPAYGTTMGSNESLAAPESEFERLLKFIKETCEAT